MPWPYQEKMTYVIAHNNTNVTPEEKVDFITENIFNQIAVMKQNEGKDIWLVGGGVSTTMLLNHDLIDEMQIVTIPTILGKG